MPAADCDVAIIGAGFAGLRAATELQRRGHRVLLLEARDRVGGRSMAATLAGRTIDVGGQWVGQGHERLTRLAQQAGAPLLSQQRPGAKLLQHRDRLLRYQGLIPPISPIGLIEVQAALWRLQALRKQVPAATPWTAARAAALDAQTVAHWQSRWIRSAAGKILFDAAVRAVFCAEARQLSMLGFLHYLSSNGGFDPLLAVENGAQAQTVVGGMHALAVHLASQLTADRLRLSTPVRALEQQADQVLLRLDHGETLRARRVIVAMAPLLAGGIAMHPGSAAREQLAQRMPMGSVIKCLVAYRTPFWRESGLNGEFVGDTALLSPVFDASPADGSQGVLVGFIDGPNAVRWSDADPAARRAAVIASLVGAFGPAAQEAIDYVDHDWIRDPWSRGCYVGLPTPGTLSQLGAALAAPVGHVHWAGTETAAQWCGYIEGALVSGERAADAVHAALA